MVVMIWYWKYRGMSIGGPIRRKYLCWWL